MKIFLTVIKLRTLLRLNFNFLRGKQFFVMNTSFFFYFFISFFYVRSWISFSTSSVYARHALRRWSKFVFHLNMTQPASQRFTLAILEKYRKCFLSLFRIVNFEGQTLYLAWYTKVIQERIVSCLRKHFCSFVYFLEGLLQFKRRNRVFEFIELMFSL